MADIKTKQERSKNMSAIKSKDTKPEIFLRRLLFSRGYRYSLHTSKIEGHPDIWMKKYNTAIFVNGCFWHRHSGCKYAYNPKSRQDFWNDKFAKNVERDRTVKEMLREKGIRCLIIWECTINNVQKKNGDSDSLASAIISFLNSEKMFEEI